MLKGVVRIVDGMLKGGEYKIDKSLSIGRNPENNLQLLCMRASRFHAIIELRDEGQYWLRDLGSTSGTLVNGEMVTERKLVQGDEVSIGDTTLLFRVDSQELPPSPLRDKHITRISFDNPENLGATAEIKMTDIRGLTPPSSPDSVSGELEKMVQRYQALYQANQLISSEAPPEGTYNEVLKHLFAVVPADRGIIMVKNTASGELVLMSSLARDPRIDISHVRVSETIISKAMKDGVATMTSDAMQDYQFARQASIHAQNIRSAICVPLLYREEEVLGVIYLDTQNIIRPFDKDMLELVTAVAGPAAIAIKNATYIDELKAKSDELRQAYLSTINVLTRSIEARDKYTIGHAWRVTRFAMALADALDWTEEQKHALEMGGVLHDVGKVGVEDAVLCKNGRLTNDEYTIMKSHPEIGARILKDVHFLQPAIPYIRDHHERWDGRGYPGGKTGDEISPEGRILSVADAFDAMTSNRIYRDGMPPEAAIAELKKCSDAQFDPSLVPLFTELFKNGKVDYVLQNKAREGRCVLCPSCSTYVELKDEAEAGDRISCPVCKRELKIMGATDGLVAQLYTATHTTIEIEVPKGLQDADTDG